MKLGFIGTGKIASSVITGICTSKISFQKIFVSPRNRNISQKLKKRFRKVNIAKTNQEIVDKCNWVFLAVTPQVGEKILPKLNFKTKRLFSVLFVLLVILFFPWKSSIKIPAVYVSEQYTKIFYDNMMIHKMLQFC